MAARHQEELNRLRMTAQHEKQTLIVDLNQKANEKLTAAQNQHKREMEDRTN